VDLDLDPVDRITTDAIGLPGERVFYLQARKDDELVTVVVEKQQVQLLSSSILEILARVGKETGQGPGEPEMELEDPIDPRWRAGRLSIGYIDDRDLLLLEIGELVDEEEAQEREGERLRVWATPEQMLSLSRHGAAVCARGRPACQFCGNPLDPEGHICPAMNGHGPASS
jgi:uncharacterized repeat protein (TIGR03847 family)